ncbi:hydroxymethylbilane synthase [Qipengyuania sp. 6B39]|uniref:hydroxymethylbilane synthase n=1 Tax=Qipengyuania proteolytica TaxID=2867239 RepID=UPI001C8A97AD|nr:hydroxymethylbilane synthase [Qipengyuania proteolytica]MBX7495303.1 hydroxymethylbilane synthase [Qipengyuania proteolytica]
MPATPNIRLGTRQSPLAMAQAHETRARLCAAHGWDESAVELVPVVASGDKVLDRPLAEIGGKALWTRELDHWLVEGRIDIAVHSMKDVETLRPEQIAICAILPRADKADRLLGAASVAAIPEGAKVGTSAPRRAAQLLHRRPDLVVVGIRGNVATRMAKLEAGEADATFLASAGLDRLGEAGVGVRLDPEDWLPAPAQAAIGIECRSDDERTRALLAAIDHAPSNAEVMAERRLLEGLGGGCSSPIAALTTTSGDALHLQVAIYSSDGATRIADEARFAAGDCDAPLALARRLLEAASPEVRALFEGEA